MAHRCMRRDIGSAAALRLISIVQPVAFHILRDMVTPGGWKVSQRNFCEGRNIRS